MTRRSLSAYPGAVALVVALGLSTCAIAKPPDLPANETITVTEPDTPQPSDDPMPAHPLLSDIKMQVYDPSAGSLIFDVDVQSASGQTVSSERPKVAQSLIEEKLPIAKCLYDVLPAAMPTPKLYQLRPTARRTLVGSILFGVNPALALFPTEKVLDAPHDHPQRVTDDDIFCAMPKHKEGEGFISPGPCEEIDWDKWLMTRWIIRYSVPSPEQNEGYVHEIALGSAEEIDAPPDHPQCVPDDDLFGDMPTCEVADWSFSGPACITTHKELDWLKWRAIWHAVPAPEQNEGYIHEVAFGDAIAYLPPEDSPAQETDAPFSPDIETLPMPKEDAATDGVTCPYLRQKMKDRHACQFADPQIGRDVLDNLERLKQADELIETAQALARDGCITEAMECCVLVEDLCPGSPSSDRAAALAFDLCFGFDKPAAATEEAEQKADDSARGPGVAEEVDGLMKACRLLMNEGLHERAAELARQAYALDPERVMADPLLYKMHLLANTSAKPASGSSEDSEPPSCPYCPSIGKPIQGIVPEKKENKSDPTTLLVPSLPPVDYEVVPALDRVLTESAKKTEPSGAEEASEEEGPSSLQELIETMMDGVDVHTEGARLTCEWSCGGNVFHLRYGHGCLAIWKTPDAAKVKP